MNAAWVRGLIAVAAIGLATGCRVPYTGNARPVAPEALTAEAGWTVAPVPAIRQVADNDCGPAALVMVAEKWQRPLALAAATHAASLSATGARLGTLRDFARSHGLRAFAVAGDRELLHYELVRGRPVIVGLARPHRNYRRTHYEVVVAIHADGRVATVDPAGGWQVRPWAALDSEWAPGGYPAMVVVGLEPGAGEGEGQGDATVTASR